MKQGMVEMRYNGLKIVAGGRIYIDSPGVSSPGTICRDCKTLADAAGQALTDLDPLILTLLFIPLVNKGS
jgi:hypothetical protein